MVKDRAITGSHDKDQFSLASYNDRFEITNSSSPSIIGNITLPVLCLNSMLLAGSMYFGNFLFFLIPTFLTLLYYLLCPYINPDIFRSFKTVIKLAQLAYIYGDKKRGMMENIEDAEIVKVQTISAKAKIINSKVPARVKKLNSGKL